MSIGCNKWWNNGNHLCQMPAATLMGNLVEGIKLAVFAGFVPYLMVPMHQVFYTRL